MTTKKPLNAWRGNKKLVWIDISNFEAICFSFVKEYMGFSEPIPEFVSRNPGILESCLETPLANFGNKDMYSTAIDKLSILFYLLIKNHPFQNGNKRLAVVTLLIILYLNNKWLNVDPISFYKFAKKVAGSNAKDKDQLVSKIKEFLSNHIILLK